MRRTVIIGGGFAGVTLAQHLERRVPADLDVVVVSAANHLVVSPWLAEAAGRSISPMHLVVAGRQMLTRARWLTARVSDIELGDAVADILGVRVSGFLGLGFVEGHATWPRCPRSPGKSSWPSIGPGRFSFRRTSCSGSCRRRQRSVAPMTGRVRMSFISRI